MARLLMIVPPVLFAALVGGLLLPGLFRENAGQLRSTLIGREAPALPLTYLPGIPVLKDADLRSGKVTVVNFWASWCPPCRAEHPVLLDMAAKGVRIGGINMMDDDGNALKYLSDLGNPYIGLATDPNGRNRVEWGVTAPPETFIVGGDGTVLFRFVGPLVGTDYETRFVPELEKALAAPK